MTFKRKGLLLDRDGVINVDHSYVGTIDRFEFMPGVFDFLKKAQDLGYYLAILTNQSGVAQALYTESDFHKVTGWMLKEFEKHGIHIHLILACFEHPEGKIEKFRRQSYWRKPNPGMVLEALQNLNLDPARSVFVGDQPRDLEAATAGHIGTCIFFNGTDQTPIPAGGLRVRSYGEIVHKLQELIIPSV